VVFFFDFWGIFWLLWYFSNCVVFSLTFGVFFDFCDIILLLWHFRTSVVFFCLVVFLDFWGLLWCSFRLGGIYLNLDGIL